MFILSHFIYSILAFFFQFSLSLSFLHIFFRYYSILPYILFISSSFISVFDIFPGAEFTEMITGLHFSESYLSKNPKNETLARFWGQRGGLYLGADEEKVAFLLGSDFVFFRFVLFCFNIYLYFLFHLYYNLHFYFYFYFYLLLLFCLHLHLSSLFCCYSYIHCRFYIQFCF